jgi:hypothetical protein
VAKTEATTSLGETIHTRTTGDAVESQAVVIAIDGSDDVVPATTNGLKVESDYVSIYDSNGNGIIVVHGGLKITGNSPAEEEDVGNPVKVGGKYDATPPTLTDGDRGDLMLDSVGRLHVADGGGSLTVDDGGGTLTVDGTVALDSGTLTALETITIGTALPAGNANIGDVDVASVPAPLSTTGGGLEATALRVTIASDSTGIVSVDDNGGTLSVDDGGSSLTVDGQVSLATGTNDIGAVVVSAVVDPLPAGNNNIGNVDVLTMPDVALDASTLAALETITIGTQLPAGVNNIGDVDVVSLPGTVASDITAIKTATEVIDNAIAGSEMQVDVVAALPAGTNNIGDVDVLTLPASSTATLSNVATSNSSVTLLTANSLRRGAVIYNDALVVMYVKFGTTASATSFTYYLAAGATLELPVSPAIYTGRIDAILASSTGTARVTELT